uniref:Uncharacterized protein n=1 Tax=Timema tahoe TaxID=61484 RepID=A0A7R9IE10_9NEOP|nr:unnamed protein product [Timema tahoe]
MCASNASLLNGGRSFPCPSIREKATKKQGVFARLPRVVERAPRTHMYPMQDLPPPAVETDKLLFHRGGELLVTLPAHHQVHGQITIQGLEGARIQELEGTKIQELNDLRVQGLKRCERSSIQGCKDSRAQGLKGTRTQGRKDSRAQGLKAARTQGRKDLRPQGLGSSVQRLEGPIHNSRAYHQLLTFWRLSMEFLSRVWILSHFFKASFTLSLSTSRYTGSHRDENALLYELEIVLKQARCQHVAVVWCVCVCVRVRVCVCVCACVTNLDESYLRSKVLYPSSQLLFIQLTFHPFQPLLERRDVRLEAERELQGRVQGHLGFRHLRPQLTGRTQEHRTFGTFVALNATHHAMLQLPLDGLRVLGGYLQEARGLFHAPKLPKSPGESRLQVAGRAELLELVLDLGEPAL